MDDGSTDNTREIVQAYKDPRVRYIYQGNQGLSAARNTGIREANFGFIAFLDADDRWRPNHLSEAMAAFAKLPPNHGLVAASSGRIDSAGQPLPTRFAEARTDLVPIPVGDIIIKTRFMPSSAVVRKSAFERCGFFDTSLKSSEDRDMWIRIGAEFGLAWLPQTSVEVRKHDANMSKNADRMHRSMETVIRRSYERSIVPQTEVAFWSKVRALHFFQYAWMLHDEGRLAAAVWTAVKSMGAWPFPLNAAKLGEPSFFRLRALLRFSRALFSGHPA